MDVDHIPTGEDAGDAGLTHFCDHRAVGAAVDFHAGAPGDFIFRNQAHRQQQGIAGDEFIGSRNRFEVFIHLHDRYAFNTVLAVDEGDGMG